MVGATNILDFSDGVREYLDVINASGFRHSVWNGSSDIDLESYQTLTSSRAIVSSKVYNPATNVSTHYINGTSSATTTATISTNWAALTFTVGNNQAAPRTFGGDIAEVIIYDRALKTEERQAIERYLGKKWGIAVS